MVIKRSAAAFAWRLPLRNGVGHGQQGLNASFVFSGQHDGLGHGRARVIAFAFGTAVGGDGAGQLLVVRDGGGVFRGQLGQRADLCR